MGVTQETSLNICAHFKPITCYQDYHQSCQEHITNYLSGRSPPLMSRVSGGLGGGSSSSPQHRQALDLRRWVPSGGGGYINSGKLFFPCLTPWRHQHRPRQPFSLFSAPDAIIIACHSPCATQPPNGGDVHIQAAENPEGPPTEIDEALLKTPRPF